MNIKIGVMKMSKTYKDALLQAEASKSDVESRGSEALGDNALEFMDTLLTPAEKSASDVRVALISELIRARQEKGISQKKLGELSGVSQPVIARMETGKTSPQLDTLMKVLAPLGKTLAIVPLETK